MLTENGVAAEVLEVVAESLGVDRARLTLETSLVDDLHVDSLDAVELLMNLEEAFDLTITDEAAAVIGETVGDVVAFVVVHLGSGAIDRSAFEAPAAEVEGASPTVARWTQSPVEAAGDALHVCEGGPWYRRARDGMRCRRITGAEGEVAPFLIDVEPVSCAAYARFLEAVEPELGVTASEVFGRWCVLAADDRRRAHFPLERTGEGWRARPGWARLPMILVSWDGAQAYSAWVHGLDWRAADACALPTDAQWLAAAASASGGAYPWGDAPATLERARVGLARRGQRWPATRPLPLAEVGAELGRTPTGLRHMAGNVWHWMRGGAERGGSWVGGAELARVDGGGRRRPRRAKGRCLGFRCAWELNRAPGAERAPTVLDSQPMGDISHLL